MVECQVFAWGMELSAWGKKVTEREALFLLELLWKAENLDFSGRRK